MRDDEYDFMFVKVKIKYQQLVESVGRATRGIFFVFACVYVGCYPCV